LSSVVAKISPRDLRTKLSLQEYPTGVVGGDWDVGNRTPLDGAVKHVSIAQRYVDGYRWEDTDLFRHVYALRFRDLEIVRGCATIEELTEQYYDEVDALYQDLRDNGFRAEMRGRPAELPEVLVDRHGEMLMGNNGNHRVAMAKILGLPHIYVSVRARHVMSGEPKYQEVRTIPAMTTPAERGAYYSRALEMIETGAVVELGAWLGASTHAIASAVRDSDLSTKMHVYDRFAWKPEHSKKAREFYGHGGIRDVDQITDCLDEFKRNLGDLLPYVTIHKGEIRDLRWGDEPIGFILFDAPKRVPEISVALTALHQGLKRGTVMAWQDFAHFPSYEIVACLSRLVQSDHLKFLEAVYPGTTVILKQRKPFLPRHVSPTALALAAWTPDEIEKTWNGWCDLLPEQMLPRFMCGAAMFLCDLGDHHRARTILRALKDNHADEIMPKWHYLREHRPKLMTQRYAPLAAELFA
jgi:predicted O-methyltransferase YrrM